jgi:hypothetical protein
MALLVERVVQLEKHVFGDSNGAELRAILAQIEALENARQPTVVCAWCQTTMKTGNEVVSHGICAPCEASMDHELEKGA